MDNQYDIETNRLLNRMDKIMVICILIILVHSTTFISIARI